MKLSDLKITTPAELLELAQSLGIENISRAKKQTLIFAILKHKADNDEEVLGDGVLDILQEGYGFLRSSNDSYVSGPDDIYVSPNQIRRFNLSTGDVVTGKIRAPKKGEKYMSAAMKKHFVAVLLLWKEHLKDEMQKTFDHLRTKGETYADPMDRASQEEEFAFELRTRDRERKLISKIAVSIEQVKQDDYGWCESCGDEIGIKRLEARPTATHCIHCKTLDEIKEKHTVSQMVT